MFWRVLRAAPLVLSAAILPPAAHQHLTQLREEDEYLYASVLTNCHNRIVFGGLSVDDAELLARQIYTGFEDLKRIKHIAWQTKFRPVEEERVVRSASRGRSLGWSEMFTESAGAASSRSHSLADAISKGKFRGLTRSANWSRAAAHTVSRDSSFSEGGQESAGTSAEKGVTRTRNWSDGSSEISGRSGGRTVAHQEGDSAGSHEQESGGPRSPPGRGRSGGNAGYGRLFLSGRDGATSE